MAAYTHERGEPVSDYFERLEAHLLVAVERETARRHGLGSALFARLRRRSRRATWVLAFVVLGGGATGALAAAGVFRTGTPVGPNVPANANALLGVAVQGTVRVLPLAVSDPSGDGSWGLRFQRTSRGLACLQYGRLVDGRIGVLGEDGFFANDRRFHPLAVNYYSQFGGGCADADSRGDAVFNTLVERDPVAGVQPSFCLAQVTHTNGGPCGLRLPLTRPSPADERLLLYGLLGPDAKSISYETPSGAVTSEETVGPEGAYLIVSDVPPGGCARWGSLGCAEGAEYQTPLHSYGVIRSVTYRDGHTCRMAKAAATCPAVGYTKPSEQRVTPAEVAAPISVHVSYHWYPCFHRRQKRYCHGPLPHGYQTAPAGSQRLGGELRATIEFVSRVAVKNVDNAYLIRMQVTPNATTRGERHCSLGQVLSQQIGGSGFVQTTSNIRTGQRVTAQLYQFPECPGVMHGTVEYLTSTGRTDPFGSVQQGPRTLVGTFSFPVP
jgi:hypothetical protein